VSVDSQFEYELKKLLSEELERLYGCVLSPGTCKDYAEYRDYIGQINAMRRVIGYCDEANTNLAKR
jgi:hypothetical protein